MLAKSSPTRHFNVQSRLFRLRGCSLDLAAFALSGFAAFELRFDGALPSQYGHPMAVASCIWLLVKCGVFVVAAVKWGHWRYTSANDVARIVLANSLGSLLGGSILFVLLGPEIIPRSVYVLDWLVCCLLTLLISA